MIFIKRINPKPRAWPNKVKKIGNNSPPSLKQIEGIRNDLFTTIPEQIENNISINFSTLGTLQSQIDFWKGQKREVEVSCP